MIKTTKTEKARAATARRRAEKHAGLRDLMLREALDLLQSHDYDAISIRAIAERIQYSPAAIYWYFKDKDDLLAHLIRAGFDELDQRCAAAAAPEQRPGRQVEAIGRAYLQFGLDHPVRYRLMFMRRADLSAPRPGHPPRTASLGLLHEALERAHQAGELVAPDAHRSSLHLWACWHGLVALNADMPYLLPGRELLEAHLQHSLAPLRSVAAPGEPS